MIGGARDGRCGRSDWRLEGGEFEDMIGISINFLLLGEIFCPANG